MTYYQWIQQSLRWEAEQLSLKAKQFQQIILTTRNKHKECGDEYGKDGTNPYD